MAPVGVGGRREGVGFPHTQIRHRWRVDAVPEGGGLLELHAGGAGPGPGMDGRGRGGGREGLTSESGGRDADSLGATWLLAGFQPPG